VYPDAFTFLAASSNASSSENSAIHPNFLGGAVGFGFFACDSAISITSSGVELFLFHPQHSTN
jgi:hypothetical protein